MVAVFKYEVNLSNFAVNDKVTNYLRASVCTINIDVTVGRV